MPDRFTFIDEPPIIVGHCTVCHNEIQEGYEKRCEFCEELVCEDCINECWVCQKKGCKWCIEKKDTNKEYICFECHQKHEDLVESIKSSDIPGYYFSGTTDADEETILEYTSLNDGPGIEVRIKKVRE